MVACRQQWQQGNWTLRNSLRICLYSEELNKAVKKIHFHLPAVKEITAENNNWQYSSG